MVIDTSGNGKYMGSSTYWCIANVFCDDWIEGGNLRLAQLNSLRWTELMRQLTAERDPTLKIERENDVAWLAFVVGGREVRICASSDLTYHEIRLP